MKLKKNKNLNTEITASKYQKVETEDYYIEAPSWISAELLDDEELCCTQYEDSIAHLHTSNYEDTDSILFENNSNNTINHHVIYNSVENTNIIDDIDDIDLFRKNETETKNIHSVNEFKKDKIINKDKTTNENKTINKSITTNKNITTKNDKFTDKKKDKSKLPPILYMPIIFGSIFIFDYINENSASIYEEILHNTVDIYTFNNTPDEIFNLSSIATTIEGTELPEGYIYKKGIGNNEVVCVKPENRMFKLNKFNNEGEMITNFDLNLDSNVSINAIHDIIELPNKDLVINVTLDKNDVSVNSLLHYNKSGYLKTKKDFNEEIDLNNLYNQPNSENYFVVSKNSGKATIHKLTGNGNKVFDYNIKEDSIESVSIFPINRDLYVFYSYYNDEYELISKAIVLNAVGTLTNERDDLERNILLSSGIATEDGGFIFEESKLYNSDITDSKTIKIDSHAKIENISIEEHDFYTNKIFKLDDGFISARETIFVPNEDEDNFFPILTFVKFDNYGKEEWRRYVNYYSDENEPIVSSSYTINHIYFQNNKVIVEGLGTNELGDFEQIHFSIDTNGDIDKM